METPAIQVAPAAWKISEFCPLAKVSRAKLYQLPSELQPRSINIGRARIIIESPGAWLARLALAQASA